MRVCSRIAAAVLGLAFASQAHALVIIAKLTAITPYQNVNMTFNGGANWRTVRAGVNLFEIVGGEPSSLAPTFKAFCIDVQQSISYNTSVTYTTGTLESAPVPGGGMGATKANRLRELWGRYFDMAVLSNTNAAAFQVAAWEIVNDNTLNLSWGNVRMDGSASTKSLAQSWLNSLTGDTSKFAPCYSLQSGTKQDMFVPSAGSLALLGLGGLVAMRRRR